MSNARVVGPRMDVAQAKALLDAGEAVVLDSVASHIWPSMSRIIKGAIRIPPEEIQDRFSELPRDKTILVYCT
jgi:rhodanese-related sulfurtransferase